MAKRRQIRNEPTQDQQQPYDNLLKSLLKGRERQMLPYFLSGVEYLETLDIEVIRTTLRVDRVYKVMYQGQEHVLHFEFETSSDNDIDIRLLEYHAYFRRKYGFPVISIIIYPFRTRMVKSPLREVSGSKEILVFHFQVFPLWELDAEQYVREHAVFMYALLPTMDGADAHLLNQAIDEMIEYYKDDAEQLGQELKWMGIVLRRADIVPLEDKHKIEERLNMYDNLIEQDPKMKKMRAESEAKGELRASQRMLVKVVNARFPALAELARQQVKHIDNPDTLDLLAQKIGTAPDENTARWLLSPTAA